MRRFLAPIMAILMALGGLLAYLAGKRQGHDDGFADATQGAADAALQNVHDNHQALEDQLDEDEQKAVEAAADAAGVPVADWIAGELADERKRGESD